MMKNKHMSLFVLTQAIRDFFNSKDFLDVMTPPIVSNPGMETHIHPFQVASANNRELHSLYLHTSPEFHMKALLSEGFEKIFTITHSFRDEPNSSTHRPQFLMLEWYRANEYYEAIMEDTLNLFTFCIKRLQKKSIPINEKLNGFTPEKKSVQELMKEFCNLDILELLDKEDLFKKIKEDHKDITLSDNISDYQWEDLFFLLFLNKVEPTFKDKPFIMVTDFPAPLSALSTLKEGDPRVCERFEVYSFGVELCNCFNELTDLSEQRRRFELQAKIKKELYGYELPEANLLYNSLEKGLPQSSGIALGVERLLMVLCDLEDPFYY